MARHGRLRVHAVSLLLCGLLLSCGAPVPPQQTGSTAPSATLTSTTPPLVVTLPPVPNGIHLSFVQQRIDEGSRRSQVRVINGTDHTMRVRAVGLAWSGFPGPRQAVSYQVYPQQTIDLRYLLPRADCAPLSRRGTVSAVVETAHGMALRPMEEDGVRFLMRLWDAECSGRRLDAAASITYGNTWIPGLQAGQPVLRGHLVLARPARERARKKISVVQLEGSVLFDLSLAGSDAQAVLGPRRPRIRIPIVVRDGGRCDPHSLGQSTQTFLFRAFLRLDDGPVLSRVVKPTQPQQHQLSAFLDQACTGIS